MSYGPVSVAPAPVTLETERKSQNFHNIRNAFENTSETKSPVASPINRQLTRISKSPSPPRVNYETKPRSHSTRQLSRTPEPLRTTAFSFSEQTQPARVNSQPDVSLPSTRHQLVMNRTASPGPQALETEYNFDFIVGSEKLNHLTKYRVPRKSSRTRRPPSPKFRSEWSHYDDKFTIQPIVFF